MLKNNNIRLTIIQSLIDARGYPKSDEDQKHIGYSLVEIDELYDKLSVDSEANLSTAEKQIILNCIDGAIHYVDIDIPALYDMSEEQLAEKKVELEKAWGMKSTFATNGE